MAQRLVDGDFVCRAAAFDFACEDFSDFSCDVIVSDQAGFFGSEEFGALAEDSFAAVGDEARTDDEVVVDFDRAGVARSDYVQMCAGLNPGAFDYRFGCGSYRADDVGLFHGFLRRIGGDRADALSEGFGSVRVASPDEDLFDLSDLRDGSGVGEGLLSSADDGEAGGVRVRQCVGRDSACRGGANGCHFSGVDDADGRSALRIEENDKALMRLNAKIGVAVEDGDQFGSEGFVGPECSCMTPKKRPSERVMIERRCCIVWPVEKAIMASRTRGMQRS